MSKIPEWAQSLQSHIWIFNVGRGMSIFIRSGLNQGIMYDFGSSQDFSPTKFLQKHLLPYLDKYKDFKIAQTIISHPHADHVSEIGCLLPTNGNKSVFCSSLHTCPHDKTEGSAKSEIVDWGRIKNPEGSDNKIKIYRDLYAGKKRNLPLQTICYNSPRSIPNLEYGIFYVRPPVVNEIHPENDHDYGNGLSFVLFYRHGKHTLLIPGDITPDVLKHLLGENKGLEKRYTIFDRQNSRKHPNWHDVCNNQPSLESLLKSHGLSVLVAPHHGLESGFSENLYEAIKNNKPDLVVISEKRHLNETDGKVDNRYQSEEGAKGLDVCIEGNMQHQYSVSTRNGHHMLITFQGTGGSPAVYLEKDPMKLLARLQQYG